MQNLFTIHKHNILFKNFDEPVYLIPFGDIHRFAPLCHEEKWLEFLKWAAKKKNTYFIGMGDYDDLASFSERRVLNGGNLHESTLESLDDIYLERVIDLCKELKFMEGKLIGLVEGNHYAQFQSGDSTTQRMCQTLKCRYLGASAFVRLTLIRKNRCRSLDLWVHHGRGASRMVGGSMNSVQQMIDCAEADIYLMGHDHKKSVAMKSRLHLSEGNGAIRLSQQKILLGRTGSFLKGYEPDKQSYIAGAALSPTDLGVLKIELTPHIQKLPKGDRLKSGAKRYLEDMYIDIHASL